LEAQVSEFPPVVCTAPGLRIRHEHFGALAWTTRPRRIFNLPSAAALVTLICQKPRSTAMSADVVSALTRRLATTTNSPSAVLADLLGQGVLVASDLPPCSLMDSDVDAIADAAQTVRPRVAALKPFWAHLQPFTVCNQACLTCYCSGGPKADQFLLPLDVWHKLIGQLDDYGVLDVYITGGESLLLDGFFDLAEDILRRGLGFGFSTNATVLTRDRLRRLRPLNFSPVQVSLDGGTPATHEAIRGIRGCWPKTLDGIRAISEFSEVVINTVVNRTNLGELEAIVAVGCGLGVTKFKFFPQKPVGRGANPVVVLDDDTIMHKLLPETERLAQLYGVDIESIDPAAHCGSGSVGFAVDQRGDMYPCIFGVENPALKVGNLVTDNLDTLWFSSEVLDPFRGEATIPCRRCEQPCLR
jgi:MoaA/NifB/PqqE/SkfB family radical SAM enzyme